MYGAIKNRVVFAALPGGLLDQYTYTIISGLLIVYIQTLTKVCKMFFVIPLF